MRGVYVIVMWLIIILLALYFPLCGGNNDPIIRHHIASNADVLLKLITRRPELGSDLIFHCEFVEAKTISNYRIVWKRYCRRHHHQNNEEEDARRWNGVSFGRHRTIKDSCLEDYDCLYSCALTFHAGKDRGKHGNESFYDARQINPLNFLMSKVRMWTIPLVNQVKERVKRSVPDDLSDDDLLPVMGNRSVYDGGSGDGETTTTDRVTQGEGSGGEEEDNFSSIGVNVTEMVKNSTRGTTPEYTTRGNDTTTEDTTTTTTPEYTTRGNDTTTEEDNNVTTTTTTTTTPREYNETTTVTPDNITELSIRENTTDDDDTTEQISTALATTTTIPPLPKNVRCVLGLFSTNEVVYCTKKGDGMFVWATNRRQVFPTLHPDLGLELVPDQRHFSFMYLNIRGERCERDVECLLTNGTTRALIFPSSFPPRVRIRVLMYRTMIINGGQQIFECIGDVPTGSTYRWYIDDELITNWNNMGMRKNELYISSMRETYFEKKYSCSYVWKGVEMDRSSLYLGASTYQYVVVGRINLCVDSSEASGSTIPNGHTYTLSFTRIYPLPRCLLGGRYRFSVIEAEKNGLAFDGVVMQLNMSRDITTNRRGRPCVTCRVGDTTKSAYCTTTTCSHYPIKPSPVVPPPTTTTTTERSTTTTVTTTTTKKSETVTTTFHTYFGENLLGDVLFGVVVFLVIFMAIILHRLAGYENFIPKCKQRRIAVNKLLRCGKSKNNRTTVKDYKINDDGDVTNNLTSSSPP